MRAVCEDWAIDETISDDASVVVTELVTNAVLPAEVQQASIAASWQVVGGIVAAFASPRLAAEAAPVVTDAAPSVEQLAARAIEHGDEHVIKLTEAAAREFRRSNDRTLLVTADRFRERVSAA
jgi:hypothetical protein